MALSGRAKQLNMAKPSKIALALQRTLRHLGETDPLTVLIKTNNINATSSFLDELSHASNLYYQISPRLKVITLSSSKGVINQLAARPEISYITENKEVRLPPTSG